MYSVGLARCQHGLVAENVEGRIQLQTVKVHIRHFFTLTRRQVVIGGHLDYRSLNEKSRDHILKLFGRLEMKVCGFV